MHGPVSVAQDRFPQRYVFDNALYAGDLHRVADVVLILSQDEKAVDEVLDQRLRTKANRDASDSSAGQQRPHIDAQQRQDLHGRDKKNDKQSNAVNHTRQRADLLRSQGRRKALPVAEFGEMFRHEPKKSAQDKCNKQDGNNAWNLVAQKGKGVVPPVVEYLKESFWGHNDRKC